jgi:hypothetical protein
MTGLSRIARVVATAAIVVSGVAVTGVSAVGAQTAPTASLEVGTPGTVDFTFVANPPARGGQAVLLLEAPATCPRFYGGSTGFSIVFPGDGSENLTFTFASGSEVQDLANGGTPVPLPDGRYQFCALWESNTGSAALLAALEAEIGVPAPEPTTTTTTVAPTTTTTAAPAAAATPRFTG